MNRIKKRMGILEKEMKELFGREKERKCLCRMSSVKKIKKRRKSADRRKLCLQSAVLNKAADWTVIVTS